MTNENDVLAGIERSVAMTSRIVAGVRDDQWSDGSPCAGWTVRDVVNHTVGGMRIFAAELTGREPEAEHEADWLGSDPVTAYNAAAELDLAAWRAPNTLAGTVTISLGTLPAGFAAVIHLIELLVHGVDVAVATSQQHLVDESLCEQVLASLVAMGGVDAYRAPGIFDAEVTTPPGAPAHQRLSAYLGRDLTRDARPGCNRAAVRAGA
jgi:uncharacterized protein (TIGR03086 family)